MSALAPSPRHPWEELLAQLTGRSGLRHGWGDEDDAKAAPINHATWTPDAPPTFAVGAARTSGVGGGAIPYVMSQRHIVTLYAGSPVAVLQRAADMVGQIDLLIGPPDGTSDITPPRPGYDVKGAGRPVKGGESGAGSWTVGIAVTLKLFVFREIWGAGSVQGVTVNTSVVHSDGTLEPAITATVSP